MPCEESYVPQVVTMTHSKLNPLKQIPFILLPLKITLLPQEKTANAKSGQKMDIYQIL